MSQPFIAIAPPPPKPFVAPPIRYHNGWKPNHAAQRVLENQAKREQLPAIYCPSCASVMSIECLTNNTFQCCCAGCGVSGPRSSTRERAHARAVDILELD